jgi:hypothetical protein
MPNWCFNRLVIDTTTEGGQMLANAFKPKYEDDDGNLYAKPFSDLMPCPDELQIEAGFFGNDSEKSKEMQQLYDSNKEKFGYAHWYDWQIAKWGTKWDANICEYEDISPNEVYVYFETAWSPPIEFFRWFADQHPDARFMDGYDEEGMQFEGRVGVEDDIGFIDESWDMEVQDVY